MKENLSAGNLQKEPASGLRIGEYVEVKSVDEILATLDENGRMEALPFMPEMLRFTGQAIPSVSARHQGMRHDQLDRNAPHA